MNKIALLTSLYLLCTVALQAQMLKPWNIPVLDGIDTLVNAGAGGLNTPQISEIDLNNDGQKDLLIYDRSAQVALTFLNDGISGQVSYRYAPEYMQNFPQNTRNFMLARDYDGDGIEDLFVFNQPLFTSGGVGIMKGSYDTDNKIQFTWVKDIVKYTHPDFGYQDIFIFNPDVPGIGDMDGDGDLDIAAFTLDFIFSRNVYFYRNMSVESGYGTDSLIFMLEHECHGMFSEGGLNNEVILSSGVDSCADNPYWNNRPAEGGPRHTGSTVTLVDWNADGVMDIVIGDVSVNNLNMLTTELVNDTFLVVSQDIYYPSYDQSVDVYSYPSAYFVDLDNDGDLDMMATPTELGIGEAVTDEVVWFYENTSPDTIWLEFRQKNLFTDEMIDLGSGAYPAIVDVNGDGLLDLVVGHFGVTDTFQTYSVGLSYFQNIGTATAPAFQLQTRDFGGFSSLGKKAMAPTFGDLDNDGDMDLILGTIDGNLIYYRNTAGVGNMMAWAAPMNNYAAISVSGSSKPQLIDMDRDGDLDLMIGDDLGRLSYFENKGTASVANFLSTPTSNTFGFDLTTHGSRSAAPHFIDTGTDFELLLGNENEPIVHLNRIEGNVTGIYDTVSLNFGGIWMGRNMAVAAADLNGDDTLDYVIGNIRGGLSFFSYNAAPYTAVSTEKPLPTKASCAVLFPNPASEQVFLRWTEMPEIDGELLLYDALGRLQKRLTTNAGLSLQPIDVSDLSSGVYFVQLLNEKGLREVYKLQIKQ